MEALLKKIYYDPAQGFKSVNNLFALAHAKDENITKAQVADFLKNQEGYQLTRRTTVNKKNYHHIIGPLGTWQIDLMFYDQYATINSHFGVFFVAIETNTRFLIIIPLKTKDQYEVLRGFSEFYLQAPDDLTPQNILSDNGTEFKNSIMKEILNELTINQYFADPEDHRKLGIIDRVIRTIRTLIQRYTASYNTHRFIDELPKLVANYNSTLNTSIGMSPSEALKHLDQIVELQQAKKENFKDGPVFRIGEEVRVLKKKTAFEKGTTQTFSKTIHVITEINGTRYKMDNGKSYPYDSLQKIDSEKLEQAPEKAKKEARADEDAILSKERTGREQRKAGVSEENVLTNPRVRQPKKHFALL